jgi:hypothetical protein
MDQPIIFLAPEAYAGRKGFQIVDDETHNVTAVVFEDSTEVPGHPPYSYRGE